LPNPGEDESDRRDPAEGIKRSKTVLNGIKLQLAMANVDFDAVAESNEAHIRLMFGAWLSMKWTSTIVLIGFFVSSLFFIISIYGWVLGELTSRTFPYSLSSARLYGTLLWTELLLYLGMRFMKRKIEEVFHYRRVGELVYVLQAWAVCQEAVKGDAPSTEN
jgi:hypothetical protein